MRLTFSSGDRRRKKPARVFSAARIYPCRLVPGTVMGSCTGAGLKECNARSPQRFGQELFLFA